MDSLRDGRSMSRHSVSEHTNMHSEGGRRVPLTDRKRVRSPQRPFGLIILVPYTRFLYTNRMRDLFGEDCNYRMAVLRLKSAVRVGRSRKADGCFLSNSDIPGGQQVAVMFQCVYYGVGIAVFSGGIGRLEGRVAKCTFTPGGQHVAVMFQIVSTMVLELPSFLAELEDLRGVSPNVHLQCEPWGPINHEDVDCEC